MYVVKLSRIPVIFEQRILADVGPFIKLVVLVSLGNSGQVENMFFGEVGNRVSGPREF